MDDFGRSSLRRCVAVQAYSQIRTLQADVVDLQRQRSVHGDGDGGGGDGGSVALASLQHEVKEKVAALKVLQSRYDRLQQNLNAATENQEAMLRKLEDFNGKQQEEQRKIRQLEIENKTLQQSAETATPPPAQSPPCATKRPPQH